jgi:hypothetical protein
MVEVSTRELLQDLAQQPIGSPELQKEPLDKNGRIKPEVKEAAKRASKLWLPQGKKPPRRRSVCNEPTAEQTDIEDAVQAAGGKRGGRAE